MNCPVKVAASCFITIEKKTLQVSLQGFNVLVQFSWAKSVT